VPEPTAAEVDVRIDGADAEDADASARAQRGAALEPLLPDLIRAAKRLLGDEHNLLLDGVRKAGTRVDPLRLLPDPEEHRDAWAHVLRASVDRAYTSGAAALGQTRRTIRVAPARLVNELAGLVVAPVRERLGATIGAVAAEGPYESTAELHRILGAAVSARYREWRSQELETRLSDVLHASYTHGAYDAAPTGARLRWVPSEPGQCPDCDDNALEPTIKGKAFPTGQAYPPAHPGCRCLVVVA
jgi:hypothetical protein